MSERKKIVFLQSFREIILLLTVFYIMIPVVQFDLATGVSADRVAVAAIQFLLLFVFLFEAALYIIKDATIFVWDKAALLLSMLFEACIIVANSFVRLPAVVDTIALFWACVLMLIGFILCVVYPLLARKGILQASVVDNAIGAVLLNYLVMAVSILAICHSVF